mmetsp:Transcript_30657/g.35224  ORF Transcript_30657/g.35224 Transcript_30657/m.35224 type:complete len:105 (+) Transcript_30657:76-390(+)
MSPRINKSIETLDYFVKDENDERVSEDMPFDEYHQSMTEIEMNYCKRHYRLASMLPKSLMKIRSLKTIRFCAFSKYNSLRSLNSRKSMGSITNSVSIESNSFLV